MSQIVLNLAANTLGDPLSWEVPLYIHVHNRVEQFVYLNEIKEGAAPIAYIENQELDSWRNLHIVNRSYQLPGNALSKIYQIASWDKVTSTAYSSPYKNISITNRTYIDEHGKTQPLFWKHVLPDDTTLAHLQLVEGGERHEIRSGYLFDATTHCIYTNYQNFFDPDTGAYKLWFVQSSTSTGVTTHSLLNPEPVISEATWEDIDLDTGDWKEGVTVYTRSTDSAGTVFYFSVGDTYYIKPLETSLIQPRKPFGRKPTDPWYLRFSAGELTTMANDSARRYRVPEYEQQNLCICCIWFV